MQNIFTQALGERTHTQSGQPSRSTSAIPLSGKALQIYEELESWSLEGWYKFGETISDLELSKEFDSSRQLVTIALNHLRSLGYTS